MISELSALIDAEQSVVDEQYAAIETAKKLNVFEEAKNRDLNQKFAALSAQLQFIEESYDYQSNVKGLNMEVFRSIMRTN